MLEPKFVKLNNVDDLVEVLDGIFKETMTGKCTSEQEEKDIKDVLKNGDEIAKKCQAVDGILEALGTTHKDKLQALSLVLRSETKHTEDSLDVMLNEFDRDMNIIATISQLHDITSAEKLINALSSAASVLAVMGDNAIKKANKNIRVHKEERVCKRAESSSENKKKDEPAKAPTLDDIIKGVLRELAI